MILPEYERVNLTPTSTLWSKVLYSTGQALPPRGREFLFHFLIISPLSWWERDRVRG
jgi:hypothetical protein